MQINLQVKPLNVKKMEQDQKLDPRDYFFGAMLQIDLGRQFSWFSMIKPQWVKQHLCRSTSKDYKRIEETLKTD